jgi:hypothetical protein
VSAPVRHGEGADAPCDSGKIRFSSSDKADEALARVRAQRQVQGGGAERRVRFCPSCAGWHLTSKRLVPTGQHKGARARRRSR